MQTPDILRHPIESFRTAPIQFIGSSLTIGMAAALAPITTEAEGYTQAIGWSVVAGNIAISALGIKLGKKQFELRNRLERILETGGFNERAMATTTSEWCTRQVARVACENYGYLEEYKELENETSEDAKFRWLPHI